MKVIIIEDEALAAAHLISMLEQTDAAIEIIKVLSSVKESLEWLETNLPPDLIFMDIELSDGLSLEIIKKTGLTCPVLFITAYDDYWQAAFEHNSIDYLLKPLKKEKLAAALLKFNDLKDYFLARYQELLDYRSLRKRFRDRFLVRRGRELATIRVTDIGFFYAYSKMVCLVDKSGSKFILDSSLADIEKQLDPASFFRVNRKYLVNLESIVTIHTLPKSRLLLELQPALAEKIIISTENSRSFKNWITR